jgi:hypothetical protein
VLTLFIALLTGFLKISWILNMSGFLNADKNFLSRLIVAIPYASCISILFSFAFYIRSKTPVIEIVLNFLIVFIICFSVFELIYTKSPSLPDEVFNTPITTDVNTDDTRNYATLRKRLNKTLDIIYYTGDFKKAVLYIQGFIENTESGKNLLSELYSRLKERFEFEEHLILKAKAMDPDFDKGYSHLKEGKLFYAERYFRNNLNAFNRYFLQKASDLLRRRGEGDLEAKFQNARRKKQLLLLGSLVEKKYSENPDKCYNYYRDIYLIYGSFGLSDKYFKYSRLISIAKITDRELDIIKSRNKALNLIYLTSFKYSHGNREIELKDVLMFIKAAYYLEGSQRVYLKDVVLIDDKGKLYKIDIARIDKNIGIAKNIMLPDLSKAEKSYISFSENVNNILEYKALNLAFEKLSIIRLLGINYKNAGFSHFKIILTEKLNYYAGFFIIFILSFSLGTVLKSKRGEIKSVLLILPLLLIFILAFFIFHISYFVSGKIIYLTL